MNTLDPANWSSLRALGHKMLDDMVDHLASIREQPVWRPMPEAVRQGFVAPLPLRGTDVEALYARFTADIQPYVTGNLHPRFMGWVHGGGNPVSMLAELLAGAMNANCGGRNHVGIAVERQVIAWAAEMLGMPAETSGVLLTGSSMANFCAVLCAKQKALGEAGHESGLNGAKLTAYASAGVHRCVTGALDMAGFGRAALRKIPLDAAFRMDMDKLREAIAADKAAGFTPFFIAATAGSVDAGAFDDLNAAADIAAEHGAWFHVDGAFGALAALSPAWRHLTSGLGRADSIAFDFHKWAQVTYSCGCLLVRDPAVQNAAFAQATNYLAAAPRGLAGGFPWPCDLGPDLSRGFSALKVWMTLSAYGTEGLASLVENSCTLAQRLAAQVQASDRLTLLAPVTLNIVCFGIEDKANQEILDLVADLQEEGLFAPSTTTIEGRTVIRCAIVNHRTQAGDIDALVAEILRRI
ncbi:pyridoxal phosphate-dependent decarboxylase family protein [Acidocella aminolytica]|jgi:glutamate/tyrosine decarboxylase-like PLP-dependent enzyme|uniref:Aromatic-L-amino-acid decarboxylase n=1 Tax=Acidocella aminolytica 101 = DSM 11237 TaxID=1120923 RepID=A0A0D6PG83_9PROT|nr:pyridoxal-dependent decarboxylase [Acidocella aminolytica]GAN80780.1 aromatic-L-amino-acid decarboxylase [Acidocella aminolytica 101 = DSM 11237]GBQ36465.1 aromatic-L-amino-acid decarboxylase [Acidocella aminolytica 101 = DSM 11237]SHE33678.1 Glutamate or tyrosine decarboxylase [Acidocella aminolytica 101 = DSM 11237]